MNDLEKFFSTKTGLIACGVFILIVGLYIGSGSRLGNQISQPVVDTTATSTSGAVATQTPVVAQSAPIQAAPVKKIPTKKTAVTSVQAQTQSASVYGCMDPAAANYNPTATSQTGATCTYPVVAPTPVVQTPSPIDLSGAGQQATQKFILQSGLSVFTLGHNGKSNFIVHLLDSNGNQVGGSLANEIGSFNGSIAVNISQGGNYLLNIDADGSWTVNIQQPRASQAPQTTNFSGHGPKATALFSMSGGLHTIAMTHNGQSNFIVHLLDSDGSQVDGSLVNEIGSFNGSKAINSTNGIYLFGVDADGDWTITIQ